MELHALTYVAVTVDDAFVEILFELIEQLANDINHPYHAPVIGVVVSRADESSCEYH